MSSDTANWEAIARYLAGESPAEEQASVRRWLAEHPTDADVVARLDAVLTHVKPGPQFQQGIDVEAALAKVRARRVEPSVVPFRRRGYSWVPFAAAAGLVLAIGIWSAKPRQEGNEVTTIAARTHTTPVGGRDSVALPDGSHVTLGPGSELTMTEGFGQKERRLTLTGDALFTVVHDDAKPFIVVANGVEIRDVGTVFVVHSDSGGVRVAVTEGVVELTAGRPGVTTLNAGDIASVSPGGEVTASRGVGAGDDLAWTTGTLVFRDTPLGQVAEDLRRWYGVHIEIPDATLRRRPLSATFKGDSLNAVLDNIALSLGARHERRGDTVVMRAIPR